jgi:hypothetical protein
LCSTPPHSNERLRDDSAGDFQERAFHVGGDALAGASAGFNRASQCDGESDATAIDEHVIDAGCASRVTASASTSGRPHEGQKRLPSGAAA